MADPLDAIRERKQPVVLEPQSLPPLHVHTNLDVLCGYAVFHSKSFVQAVYLIEEPAGFRVIRYADHSPGREEYWEDEDGLEPEPPTEQLYRLWLPTTQYYVKIDAVIMNLRRGIAGKIEQTPDADRNWEISAHIPYMTWSREPLSSLDDPVMPTAMPNVSDGHPCMGRAMQSKQASFDPVTHVNRAQQLITEVLGVWHGQVSNNDMRMSQFEHPTWERLAIKAGYNSMYWDEEDSLVEGLTTWEQLGDEAAEVLLGPDDDWQLHDGSPRLHMDAQGNVSRSSWIYTWRTFDPRLTRITPPEVSRTAEVSDPV